MITYTLNYNRRTKRGKALYSFLSNLNYLRKDSNTIIVDERDTFNKHLVEILFNVYAIRTPEGLSYDYSKELKASIEATKHEKLILYHSAEDMIADIENDKDL